MSLTLLSCSPAWKERFISGLPIIRRLKSSSVAHQNSYSTASSAGKETEAYFEQLRSSWAWSGNFLELCWTFENKYFQLQNLLTSRTEKKHFGNRFSCYIDILFKKKHQPVIKFFDIFAETLGKYSVTHNFLWTPQFVSIVAKAMMILWKLRNLLDSAYIWFLEQFCTCSFWEFCWLSRGKCSGTTRFLEFLQRILLW